MTTRLLSCELEKAIPYALRAATLGDGIVPGGLVEQTKHTQEMLIQVTGKMAHLENLSATEEIDLKNIIHQCLIKYQKDYN